MLKEQGRAQICCAMRAPRGAQFRRWLRAMIISSLTVASTIWWLFCAKSTWELSETTAACVRPMQTIQVLAQVSSVRCMNNLVDSRDASRAFTIRRVLVPVAEGSQELLLQSHRVTSVFDAYRDFQRKSLQTLGRDQICLFMLSIITSLCWHFLSLQRGRFQSSATWGE